jgi:hypothetical protein
MALLVVSEEGAPPVMDDLPKGGGTWAAGLVFYVWVKTGMEVSHFLKLYSYIMSVLLLNAPPPSLERIGLSQTPTKSVETDARPSLVHHPIMRRDEANAP